MTNLEKILEPFAIKFGDIIYKVNSSGILTYLSENVFEHTGWAADEWVGKQFIDLLHKDSVPIAAKDFSNALSNQPTELMELKIIAKSGEYLTGDFFSMPDILNGKVTGVTGIARDITQYKKTEEELDISKKQYCAVIENTHEGILIVDDNNNITYSNSKILQLLNYSINEMLGKPFVNFIHKDKQKFYEQYSERQKRGKVDIHKFELLKKDGSELPCTTTITPILNRYGRYMGALNIISGPEIDENINIDIVGLTSNITNYKKSSELFTEIAVNYRKILESIAQGFFVIDENNIVVFVNSRLSEITGYETGELIGSSMLDYLDKDKTDLLKSGIEKHKAGIPVINNIFQYRKKNGDNVWINYNVYPIFNINKKYLGIFGTVTDITEKKLLEDRLYKNEEKFSKAFDANPMLMAISETDSGKFIEINETFLKTFGFTKEQVIGNTSKNLNIFQNPEFRSKAVEIIREKGELINFPVTINVKDNLQETGLFYARPMNINNRDCLITIFHDMTNQISMENKILRLNRILTSIKNINELILKETDKTKLLNKTCDLLTTVSEYKICWIGKIDEKKKQITPVAYAGIDGLFINSLKIPFDNGLKENGLTPVTIAAKTKKYSVINNTLMSTMHNYWKKEIDETGCRSIASFPLLYNDVLFGILTICSSHSTQFDRDEISLLEEISKNIAFALNSIELKENYKQREMELIQSQKMAAVGVLSSGIAHEINNPLSAIIGEVQWLIEKQKNKKLLKSLKLLQKLCLKIAAIVQKLLIFSSQKTDSRNKKFNINDIINETISLVEKKLKLHNIKLTKHLDKTAPLLSINRNEMGQVIMNILFNSIDAMNNMAGSLTISTEFDNTKKYVLIKFEDTGTGISEENLPKIFDPFFTTKPVGKGTGLGLSISYKIIENTGGSLEIESKGTNMGTAAIIKLPV